MPTATKLQYPGGTAMPLTVLSRWACGQEKVEPIANKHTADSPEPWG